MKYLWTPFVFILFLISCNKEPILFNTACEQTIMDTLEMVPIEGQFLNCEPHLLKFSKGEETYFGVGSHCWDYVLVLLDCHGNKAFSSNQEQEQFLRGASNHGIIAYQPD